MIGPPSVDPLANMCGAGSGASMRMRQLAGFCLYRYHYHTTRVEYRISIASAYAHVLHLA